MKPKRVLFVCIGNACRSQMAEGFARALGGGAIEAASAGLSPAAAIPRETRSVMAEKGIALDSQFPKSLEESDPFSFDLIVNMSGVRLRGLEGIEVLNWAVDDPVGPDLGRHAAARDRIEGLLRDLLDELRGD